MVQLDLHDALAISCVCVCVLFAEFTRYTHTGEYIHKGDHKSSFMND